MELNRYQIKFIKLINGRKGRNLKFSDVLFQVRSLPLLIAMAIVIIIFKDVFGKYFLLLPGIILGAIARDFAFAARQKIIWSVLKEIIDWQKVDNLSKDINI